ncbi:hypothetical protein KUTeg_010913 [Tegillarca granosa]|uniref:LDLR chaperone MESD n=1 Tax=Tegillarca granosa TaxID=220873 RepID=A0ABQ9F2D5_TEGGR|nr:hypothetical protein KUTeg_010913 [Tegillarca granosa]
MRYIVIIAFFLLFNCTWSKESKKDAQNEEKDKWKKKDVRDFNDADVERLYDQWEEDEEDLPYDELPEWKKDPPKVDLSQLDPSNPEKLLMQSKRGRTLMIFATVAGNPTEKETEQITSLWHTSLFNAQYEIQRYVVGTNRVLFMMNNGAKAWEIKDYLVSLESCAEVTVEGKSYPGKGALMEQQKRAEATMKKEKEEEEEEEIKADDDDEENTNR